MNAQHTPGPWFAATGSSSYDIADQDGRLLARLWGDKGNYPLSQFADASYLTHDEHVANALLMAAGPHLVHALERILRYEDELSASSWGLAIISHAKSALVSARQGSHA